MENKQLVGNLLPFAVKNANAGKTFKIVCKEQLSNKGNVFYTYSIFVVAKNRLFELSLKPELGRIKDGENVVGNRIAGAETLAFMMDVTEGNLLLTLREESYVGSDGKTNSMIKYYAVAVDEATGLVMDFPMQPYDNISRHRLLSAFSGFGGSRDYTDDDVKKIPQLKESLKNAVKSLKVDLIEDEDAELPFS